MGLHISLAAPSGRGPYSAIYVGESAADARVAEARSTSPWIIRIDNPSVLRKHNSNAEANADKATPPEVEEAVEEAAPSRRRR